MKNQLFNFDVSTADEDKAAKVVSKEFAKHGLSVVSTGVEAPRRTSGISYREFFFSFSDSQTVRFMVTRSGDVFEVKINGRTFPIKNQDDHTKAILEVVNKLDAGRKNWQRKMDRVRLKDKSSGGSISTSRAQRLKQAQEKAEEYREMVASMSAERDRMLAELDRVNKQISAAESASDDTSSKIIDALKGLSGGSSKPIRIAVLRKALPDESRNDVDASLLSLEKDRKVRLSRQDNPMALTDEDHEAAIVLAGGVGVRHLVYLDV